MDIKYLHVEIEPTNQCNTRCLHCPHETITRPSGKMDWETYKTVADKILAYVPDFSFEYAGMGDPLLNPHIYDFVKYVSGRGFTSATTNAAALTPKNIEKIIDAGLGRLTISFNGTDPELYELMMGGLSFARAENHLKTALEMTRGTKTEIGANISVTRQTQSHLAEIDAYLTEAGISTKFFSKCHHRGGFLKGDLVCRTPPPPVDDYRCDIFTNTLFVAWTGQVLSCCHDLAGSAVVGDLLTESLEDITARKMGIAADGVKFDICKGCNDLYRFMDDGTPDGRQIGDWVYDLFIDGELVPVDTRRAQPTSSLSRWLFDIYTQENRQDKFFSIMETQLREKPGRMEALEKSQQELEAIHASRSWRVMEKLHGMRHAIIPLGSARERKFKRVLDKLGL